MAALNPEQSVAVIGAGTMGAGIAQVAAAAGHAVTLFDVAEGAAEKGVAGVKRGLERLVSRGKMDGDTANEIVQRIKPVSNIEALAGTALVVEAIVENLDVKRKVFAQLEEICGEDVILATNTSSISVTAIGAELQRPQNLVGMHFFNPAPIMKLVEVISGVATSPEIAEIVYETSANWGKHPVHAKSTPGFIVNRVARPFYTEGMRVYQEGGADIATIDAVIKQSGGFRMGPFELMDLIGNDVNYAVSESVFNAYYQDPRFKPSVVQLEQVNAGYLGRKTGRGYYQYGDDAPEIVIENAASEDRPSSVQVRGELGVAADLIADLETAGVSVERVAGETSAILVDDLELRLTDGRTATQVSAQEGIDNVVLFDLALDYQQASRIALAPSDLTASSAVNKAIGLFQLLGKEVSVIDDIPGMLVMRTVCALANEGADTVNQQVCSAAAVDIAMQGGVNYPRGPLAWADQIGLEKVVAVLSNLFSIYGEDRYRVSPLLQRKVFAGKPFIE